MNPYIHLNQSQAYLPNLLAVSGPFVVNRSLNAMADIPTQPSNPNRYSLRYLVQKLKISLSEFLPLSGRIITQNI